MIEQHNNHAQIDLQRIVRWHLHKGAPAQLQQDLRQRWNRAEHSWSSLLITNLINETQTHLDTNSEISRTTGAIDQFFAAPNPSSHCFVSARLHVAALTRGCSDSLSLSCACYRSVRSINSSLSLFKFFILTSRTIARSLPHLF